MYRPVREFAVQRGWKLKPQQANGNTVDAIIAFVETKKQDLIVMRTHGHSSLLNVALRSVTTGELSRCEVSMPLLR